MSTNLQEMGNGCPIYLSEKNFNAVELDIRNNDMNDRMWMLLSEIGNVNKYRIPMFYSIEQALQTIGLSCKDPKELINKEFYVHIPFNSVAAINYPDTIDVPYANLTNELWVTNNIKVACIGKIKVTGINDGYEWELSIGSKKLFGYNFTYDFIQTYRGRVFQEAQRNLANKNNAIYYACKKHGLKTIKPKKGSNRITAYKSKKKAIIMAMNDEKEFSIREYEDYTNIESQDIVVEMGDEDFILDSDFSLYEVADTGYKEDDRHSMSEVYFDKPVKVINEYRYDSWVKVVNEIRKNKIKFVYKNGIDADRIVRYGGYYGEEGIWNSIIYDKESGKYLRERVETLIINKDKVFLRMIPGSKNKYRLPGGSTEKGLTLEAQAINECNEESKLNIKNIYYTGIKYTNLRKSDWVKKLPFQWEGTLSHVFVANYAGKHKQPIHKIDEDNDMSKNGKFYKISEVYSILSPEHQKAIDRYFRHRRKRKLNKKIDKLKESIDDKRINTSYEILKEINNMETSYTDDVIISDLTDRLDTMSQTVNNFELELPEALPAFTPDQMVDLGVFNEDKSKNCYGKTAMESYDWFVNYSLSGNPGNDWLTKCMRIYEEYKANSTPENAQRLLEIGWNPEIELTTYSIKAASKITRESLVESFGGREIVDVSSLLEDYDGGLVDSNRDDLMRAADKVKSTIIDIMNSPEYEWIKNKINISFYEDHERDYIEGDKISIGDYGAPFNNEDDSVNKDALITLINAVNRQLKVDGELQYEINKIEREQVKDGYRGKICVWQRAVANDTSIKTDMGNN